MSDFSSSSSASSGGISALCLLGVVFVTLKLLGITEVATWSWWWITAPFWIELVVFLSILLFAGLVALVVSICTK